MKSYRDKVLDLLNEYRRAWKAGENTSLEWAELREFVLDWAEKIDSEEKKNGRSATTEKRKENSEET